MIKGFILLTKKADISDELFNRHWLNVHGPLAFRLKSLRRYIQSHRIMNSIPEFPASSTYSGIAEVWMDNLQAAQGIPEDPDYINGLYQDEPNFLIREETRYLFTEEHIIVEPPDLQAGTSPYIKSLYLTLRKPGLSVRDFQQHWLEKHAPLIPKIPGLLGYTQAHVLPEVYEQEQPCFDGVAELWWPDIDTFLTAWNSQEHRDEQVNDLQKFIDMENTIGMLVTPKRLM